MLKKKKGFKIVNIILLSKRKTNLKMTSFIL